MMLLMRCTCWHRPCSGLAQVAAGPVLCCYSRYYTACADAVVALGMGAGHFGHKTPRHNRHNRCRSLRRITGGAVSYRNCPGSKCPGFSSITALVSKCVETGAEVSQSVLMPKCPVTLGIADPCRP